MQASMQFAVGERLYYTGPDYVFRDGDRVAYGEQAEVVGPARDGEDKLKVNFPGNKMPMDLCLAQLSRSEPPLQLVDPRVDKLLEEFLQRARGGAAAGPDSSPEAHGRGGAEDDDGRCAL